MNMKQRLNYKGYLFTILLGYTFSIFTNSFMRIFTSAGNGEMVFSQEGYQFILSALYVIILVPIIEEIVFRGVLFAVFIGVLTKLKHNDNIEKSVIIISGLLCSVVFGILHTGNIGKIAAFFFSCLLCYLAIQFKIKASIMCHIAFNATSFIIGLNNSGGVSFVMFIVGLLGLYSAQFWASDPDKLIKLVECKERHNFLIDMFKKELQDIKVLFGKLKDGYRQLIYNAFKK